MKLPSVYANRIEKVINNNNNYYRGDNKKDVDVSKLRKYFDHNGYVNKLEVRIITKDSDSIEKLILFKDSYFVTINNKRVYFKDIVDYEIKK